MPLVAGALVILCLIAFLRRGESDPSPGGAGLPGAASGDTSAPVSLADVRPVQKPHGGYVGSAACRECHEDKYDSWHGSYHRTMTQVATPETVIGDFNDVALSIVGTNGLKRFNLRRNEQHFWVETLTDKELVSGPEGLPAAFPVVMTTGSHHMQAYWLSVGEGRTIGMLPFVYLRAEQRWIPRRSSFLKPPGSAVSMEIGRWDDGCVRCHTTGGRPKRIEDGDGAVHYDSAVSEFGISCEACHGRGEEHMRLWRQAKVTGNDPADDPIVDPDDLDTRVSAQVCGGCHSAMFVSSSAHVHVPGQNIDTNKAILMGLNERTRDYLKALYPDETPEEAARLVEMDLKGMFWSDGVLRVVGREYTSLQDSGCHLRGKMACTSCHKLHKSDSDERSLKQWADDQLNVGMRDDRACVQCHEAARYTAVKHTHHQTDSEGSRCLNCHMPHATYGLLKASRSHSISSPSVRETLTAQRPNACNLCHLDKTLAWTGEHLEKWWGIAPVPIPAPWQDTSAAVVGALRGDAAVRALMAWHFGWEPARKASGGDDWAPPILTVLMDDDYDAVRYIAGRSLRQIKGYQDATFDFLAPQDEQRFDISRVLGLWAQKLPHSLTNRPEILMSPDGNLDMEAVRRHLTERDTRPVVIIE